MTKTPSSKPSKGHVPQEPKHKKVGPPAHTKAWFEGIQNQRKLREQAREQAEKDREDEDK